MSNFDAALQMISCIRDTHHEIEDGRFFEIIVYNDKTGSMRKEFFTQ